MTPILGKNCCMSTKIDVFLNEDEYLKIFYAVNVVKECLHPSSES